MKNKELEALVQSQYKQLLELQEMLHKQTVLFDTQKQVMQEKSKRVGFIYAWVHKTYKTTDYVGYTKTSIDDRTTSHINTMISAFNVPFYKSIIALGVQQYTQVLLERVEYTEDQELLDRELHWQREEQSI